EGLFRQLDRLYRDLGQPAKRAEVRSRATFGDAATRTALLTERVELLVEAHQHEAAIEAARALQAARPNDRDLARRLAELAARMGDAQTRKEALLGVLRTAPDEDVAAAARELADLAAESRDVATVRLAWREALRRRPDDGEALRALGESLASDEALRDELIEVLRRRLELAHSNDDDAQQLLLLHRLADLHGASAQLGEQEAMLKRALEVDPDDEAAFEFVEQRLTARAARPELAALMQELAARRTDTSSQIALWLRAARLLAGDLGQRGEARRAYQQALALDRDHTETLTELAALCSEEGENDTAANLYERAVARLTGAPLVQTLCALGRLYDEKLGRTEPAIRCYRRALEADATSRGAASALRSLYQRGQRWAELTSLLEGLAEHLDRREEQAGALLEAASLVLDQGAPGGTERAEQLLRRALELAPQTDGACDRLAEVLTARGDHAAAQAVLEELRRRRGGGGLSIEQLLALAGACAAQGQTAAAQGHLRLLLQRAPSHLEALRALGDLLLGDGDADAEETIAVLEQRLLHHGPKLDSRETARVHGQIGILRRGSGDMVGARKALRHALNLMDPDAPDTDVLTAHAELLIDENNLDEALVENERLAQLLQGAQAAARWMVVGQLAESRADGQDRAAHAYAEACRLDPNRLDAFENQLRVEAARGNAAGALQAAEALLEHEVNLQRLSRLEAAVAAICLSHLNDPQRAATYLKRAIEHDAENAVAIAAAEHLFEKLGDHAGLNQILGQALVRTPREHPEERRGLLERLVQIRRYELRDLPGAIAALEELLQLDDENTKAREDLGRLLVDVGAYDKALATWREVLTRDPLALDAYRAMFNIVRRQRAHDQAYAIAATMVALEKADDEVRTIVKQLRAPFPNWPRAPAEPKKVRSALLHPLTRGPVRELLAITAPVVWSDFARELRDFGLRRRDLLAAAEVPKSVLLAVRQAARMLNLAEPELFRGAADSVGVSLLPVNPPALMIGADVLRGGMTPERAFAFGRAIAYLQPENLVAASLSPNELRGLIESVLLIAMPKVEMDAATREFARLGSLIERRVKPPQADRLIELGREYYRIRAAFSIQELIAALGFSADRVGFVFAGELAPAVAALKAAAGQEHLYPARLAIRELVLFSVSADYFALRRELGLTVSESDAERVLGLG
ncbi:MAG: tetratricopeptide repeat protein, partial [Deltaproteobacteria bacterium]|nr:tetratricopeptide repeat protein [Deltaproteobacteria bacterium]